MSPGHIRAKAFFLYVSLLTLAALLAIPRQPPPAADPSPPSAPRSIYDGYATPAAILRAHARAESDEMDWAIGDDGKSRGRMQINETFHIARAARWGEYDPHNCFDAIRIADRIWQDNYARFAAMGMADRECDDLTIAAYRQGFQGVVDKGPTAWYIKRVRDRMGP